MRPANAANCAGVNTNVCCASVSPGCKVMIMLSSVVYAPKWEKPGTSVVPFKATTRSDKETTASPGPRVVASVKVKSVLLMLEFGASVRV